MKMNAKTALLLGLDSENVSILELLEAKELSIAMIASHTGIPRTSLYYMLPKLAERGFIEKTTLGKKIFWKKVSDSKILETYTSALQKESTLPHVTLLSGANTIEVFNEIASMPRKSRFYGIQPEQSIIQAVTKNPIEKIVAFNNKINAKEIIAEGIIHEHGTDSMVEVLSKEDGKKLLKSFVNRSADTVKLPPTYLHDTKAEIYLYEDKVAIVNWYKEFAVIIKNKDVFDLLKSMFDSTKYLLKRYDQNEKIARKLLS